MSAAVETMMYNNREVPWHGLGQPVEGTLTAAEAIIAAGLDWRVSLEPICTEDGDVIDGHHRIARDKDDATLGIVGKKYVPIQNAEAFEFMDNLADTGLRYETAGSLKGGRVVWMLAEMPEGVTVAGEEVKPYLLLSTNHDGGGACKVQATPVRVVCANTLAMAAAGAKRTYKVRHTGTVNGKIAEAREVLELGFNYYGAFEQAGEALAGKKWSDADFARFLDGLLPLPEDEDTSRARVENRRSDVAKLYFGSPNLENVRGTAWAAYNAAAEYADHFAEVRGDNAAEQRTFRAWYRPNLTSRAFEIASAM